MTFVPVAPTNQTPHRPCIVADAHITDNSPNGFRCANAHRVVSSKTPYWKEQLDNHEQQQEPEQQPAGAPTGRSSITDVAHAAGVSVVTAQRVFRGFRRIAESTRQKVLKAARDVGYHPNVTARALRTGKIPTIAFVPTAFGSLAMEFYSDMLQGFIDETVRAGLDTLLAVPPPDADINSWLADFVASGRCGAVALHLEIVTDENLQMLRSLGVPTVILNYVPDVPAEQFGISCAGFDHAHGVREVVRHLAGLGHRHIAYFGGPAGWQDSIRREAGFRNGMAESGLDVRPDWVASCMFKLGAISGQMAADPIIAQGSRAPTAMVCASDDIALGVMSAIRHRGRRVPHDFSVVGFDDTGWAGFFNPPLTTVRHCGSDLGKASAVLLLARYGNPMLKPETTILPTQFVLRDSTAPPPKR